MDTVKAAAVPGGPRPSGRRENEKRSGAPLIQGAGARCSRFVVWRLALKLVPRHHPECYQAEPNHEQVSQHLDDAVERECALLAARAAAATGLRGGT